MNDVTQAFVASALPLNQAVISLDFFNEPITYITHQGLCGQVMESFYDEG